MKTKLEKVTLTKEKKDGSMILMGSLFQTASLGVMLATVFRGWLATQTYVAVWAIHLLTGAVILWMIKSVFFKTLSSWTKFYNGNVADHAIIVDHMDTMSEFIMKIGDKVNINTDNLKAVTEYVRREKQADDVLGICRSAFDATVEFHSPAINSLPYKARQYINMNNEGFRKFVLQIVEEDFFHLDKDGRRIDNFTNEAFRSKIAANSMESAMNAEKLLGKKPGKMYIEAQTPYFNKYLKDVRAIIEGNPNNKSKRFFKLSLTFLTQGISNILAVARACEIAEADDIEKKHETIFTDKDEVTPAVET